MTKTIKSITAGLYVCYVSCDYNVYSACRHHHCCCKSKLYVFRVYIFNISSPTALELLLSVLSPTSLFPFSKTMADNAPYHCLPTLCCPCVLLKTHYLNVSYGLRGELPGYPLHRTLLRHKGPLEQQ